VFNLLLFSGKGIGWRKRKKENGFWTENMPQWKRES
jgi:hypothetical protein